MDARADRYPHRRICLGLVLLVRNGVVGESWEGVGLAVHHVGDLVEVAQECHGIEIVYEPGIVPKF